MSLQWSDSLPTVEGWYYVQNRSLVNDKPFYPVRCVRVFFLNHWRTGERILVCKDWLWPEQNERNNYQSTTVLSELSEEQWWSGPLPEPEIWNGD